jgi:hypothetical protein
MAAEAALTVKTSSEAGARIDTGTTYSTANTDGHTFANDGTVLIFCHNTDAAVDPVLTITGQNACIYGVIHTTTYTMTHAQAHVIGPFSTAHFNDTAGLVHIDWSATESDCAFYLVKKGPTLD